MILFHKLEHYGIRGIALDWITNYFCDRLQYVQYDDSYSTFPYEVPQGPILGPLLYNKPHLLYINDLSNVANIFDLILFADDTNLFYSRKDPSCLINLINDETSKLSEWFKANMLSINIKKSNYTIFKPRQKRHNIDLLIMLNDHKIDLVKEVVFLGVILDEHISLKPHISHVSRKKIKINKYYI